MTNVFREQLNKLKTEIKTLENYDEKLKKWAEFTVDYCDNVARHKIDRSFYVFQSEPSFEPEVLILGLNPQDQFKSRYLNQYENVGWGLSDYGKMTADVLIHQNPWYIGGKQAERKKKEWNILRNLKKTINVHHDLYQLFDNMVYMNILYFNSTNFVEFKNSFPLDWKDVFENCVELSSLLIYEIIKPKTIICLGIDNCFKSFIGNSPNEELINRSLYKCKVNGINIYGITHPSARKTNFSRENIGWHIYADLFNKPIFNLLENKISIIYIILSEIATKHKLGLVFDKNKLCERFGYFKFLKQNQKDISIYFEFQKPLYSDLRYEEHQDKFLNTAINCISPYDNWLNLSESFNQESFRNYFESIINIFINDYKL
jgi:hypothetical protein